MATTLHALIVEDSESDAELLVRHLQKAEFDVVCERVETAAQMSAKLEESTWDIVIADYRMPLFSAPAALEVLHSSGRDIPFIVVSGTIGEETAVVMMKSGAHDYFLKDSLTRLPAAVRREIREAELRNEKRRSEEAARENEIRFRRMFEDGPIGMAMAGADFRFIRVNEAFCAMLGYTEKEILALTFADLTHPDNLAADLESEKKLRFGEIPIYRTEKRYIRKDKAEVWGALTLSAIHDKDGKFQYFLGSVVDITERKRAEEALRNSELQYRTTIDAINDSIAVIDSDLRIVLVNESFKKWNQHLGLQPGAQGRIILDVLPFLSKDAPQEYARVFSTAETLTTEEHYTFGANEVFAEIRKIPLLEGGRVMRVVTVIRDITDQELSRRRLEEERNLLKTILEAIPEAIAVKDTQRRFILANPATFKALNRKSENEIIGKRDEDLIPREFADRAREEEQRILATGQPLIEVTPRTKIDSATGKVERSILISKIPITDSLGRSIGLVAVHRDVTELQRAEHALRESWERYQDLVENINEAIFSLDLNGLVTYISPVVRTLGGYTPEEVTGQSLAGFILPEDLQAVMRGFERVRKGEYGPTEFRIRKKTGEIRWLRSSSRLVVRDGKMLGTTGVLTDITDQKHAENLLRKSEQFNRRLVEHSPVGILFLDAEGRITYVNPAMGHMIALSEDQQSSVEGLLITDLQPFKEVMDPQTLDRLLSNAPLTVLDAHFRSSSGREIDFTLYTAALTDALGKREGTILTALDVTAQKQAQQQNVLLAQSLKSSRDCISITDLQDRIIFVNDAFLNTYGYTEDELIGKNIVSLRSAISDPSSPQDVMSASIRNGWHGELVNRRKNGTLFPIELWTSIVHDNAGTPIAAVGVARDISDRKQLQQQLIQAQKMESIGTLAGGVAHDFNNILAIILGHLELIERKRDDEVRFRKSVAQINTAVDRGAALVRQILTFARKAETKLQPVNINAVVRELSRMLTETFPKTVTLTLNLEKSIPVISMDSTQLHQTLLNLCVNARDAMDGKGNLTISTALVRGRDIRMRFSEALASQYVHVAVADTGAGMAEEVKSRIFEPFFTTKGEEHGTGLGLAVVYGVMRSHNGFIECESAPGAGTTFHLYFPVPGESLEEDYGKVARSEQLVQGKETVLVAEDEEALREVLIRALTMRGYKVITAGDGEEALKLFDQRFGEIDVVLTDQGLPKHNGLEISKYMLGKKAEVKMLLLSGYLEPNQRSEILKAGIKRIISKPYHIEDVLEAIREAISDGQTIGKSLS